METARSKYLTLGIQSLPTQENKAPKPGISWKDDVSEKEFKDAYGIGLKCGKPSNGLECLDFDNHFDNAEEICQDFLNDEIANKMMTDGKLFVQSTRSGGYHVVFFSDYYEGNQKIAREEHSETIKTVIETRGDGGYFCAYPTPGYEWSRHSIYDISRVQKISKEEREYLINLAKSYNRIPENNSNIQTNFGISERAGDRYNEDPASHSEALTILENNGWTGDGKRLTRPGKSIKNGISATFGHVAPGVLYVFSSNAHPFEEGHAYKPFQIKSLLEYDGDFKSCAKELAERYGLSPKSIDLPEESKKSPEELFKMLERAKIDDKKVIIQPKPILTIIQKGAMRNDLIDVFHLADFSVLIGKQKSKKTYFSSVIASAMAGNRKHSNRLQTYEHTEKKRIAFFDTEQGDYFALKTAKRINAECGGQLVDYFALRDFDQIQRRDVIEFYLKQNPDVFIVIIDGIVDLIYDFNNLEDSTKLVQWVMKMTKVYNVHFLNIIHQNKADGNARGHLGTILCQKAETVIEIKKANEANASIISSSDTRGRSFNDFMILIDGNGNPVLMDYEKETQKEIF